LAFLPVPPIIFLTGFFFIPCIPMIAKSLKGGGFCAPLRLVN
jgi:hypothetical protein